MAQLSDKLDKSTCSFHTDMGCWPKDRQANNVNENNAISYGVNFVDNDPADSTNLCFTDSQRGNLSTNLDSYKGFVVIP